MALVLQLGAHRKHCGAMRRKQLSDHSLQLLSIDGTLGILNVSLSGQHVAELVVLHALFHRSLQPNQKLRLHSIIGPDPGGVLLHERARDQMKHALQLHLPPAPSTAHAADVKRAILTAAAPTHS